MPTYKCKKCGKTFPIPAWNETVTNSYLPICADENVTGVTLSPYDIRMDIQKTPCCPFCRSLELEEAK